VLWGWKNGEKIFMDKLEHEIWKKVKEAEN